MPLLLTVEHLPRDVNRVDGALGHPARLPLSFRYPPDERVPSESMYGTAARGKNAVDEVRLASAAAKGDGSAFATLYQRYEDLVFNLAYRIGGSEKIACEAVEKAFLGMMRERGPVTEHGTAI